MGKSSEKWVKREGCKCFKCREVEYKEVVCKEDRKNDSSDLYEKIVINVECNNDHDKKDHDKKDDDKKNDRNEWIREVLKRNFLNELVTVFTKDSTHAEGILDEVKKEYLVLRSSAATGSVDVESNAEAEEDLETFDRYFVRLDCICGFGQEIGD